MQAKQPAPGDGNIETTPRPPLKPILNSLNPQAEAAESAAAEHQHQGVSASSKQPIPRRQRVSLTFWKTAVAKEVRASPAESQSTTVAYPSPPPIGHQARVLFALLTGQTPPPRPGRLQHGPSSFGAGATKLLLSTPTLSQAAISSGNAKAHQKYSHKPTKAAQHQQKAMKKLKEQLLSPVRFAERQYQVQLIPPRFHRTKLARSSAT